MHQKNTPTGITYRALENAFTHFSDHLFAADSLPHCLIVLNRSRRSTSYFSFEPWGDITDNFISDEIVLNPSHFQTRPIEETLAALVHEMCHLWQHHNGEPSRKGYHNREWSEKMLSIGLIPSDTGEPGGKQTGQKMSHYIEPDGHFDRACRELLKEGFAIAWHALEPEKTATTDKNKIKYSCPDNHFTAWAKPEIKIICGECGEYMDPQ